MVTNNDLIGKKTVIYFYPKDSTPGCTAEACNIRDNYHVFLAQGYQIYGVSKVSQASHIKFKEKYDLPFPLLSDPTTEMLQAFGAWGEKKNYGKLSMGTLRKTFIFNENGVAHTLHCLVLCDVPQSRCSVLGTSNAEIDSSYFHAIVELLSCHLHILNPIIINF